MSTLLQICGLSVIIILIGLYLSHRTLHLPGERSFSCMLFITGAFLILDILSVLCIRARASLPPILVDISCKGYMISVIWVCWSHSYYVATDLRRGSPLIETLTKLAPAVAALFSVAVCLLPYVISDENGIVIVYGAASYLTYFVCFVFTAATLICALLLFRRERMRKVTVVFIAIAIWLAACLLQFAINRQLIGFAGALIVMLIYCVLENPDIMLDRGLDCFNTYGLSGYLDRHMKSGISFYLMDFSVINRRALTGNHVDVKSVLKDIARSLENERHLYVFKGQGDELIFASEDESRMNDAAQTVLKQISGICGVSDGMLLFTVNNAQRLKGSDELFDFLDYVKEASVKRFSTVYHVPDKMVEDFIAGIAVEEEIDAALREDRVEVFLQPICPENGTVPYAEALVRIRKPEGGYLSPGQFIPAAEASGQIKELGTCVLEKVCGFLRDTEAVKLGLRKIEVNLSAVQCDDSSLAVTLAEIVSNYGVRPELINFEITETAISTARDALRANMDALVSRGFSFSLDDFGEGESNLMYLLELPVQILKYDMDMTRAYLKDTRARVIVNSVTEMAHELQLKVVAEGVESMDDAGTVYGAGVDYIQGYCYSRPIPMPQFLELLRERNGCALTADAENVSALRSAQSDPSAADEPLASRSFAGKRVLLVEDNEINREVAAAILEDFDIQVDTADDGVTALEQVKAHTAYDLVLMDIRMPVMDGYEATRKIRAMKDKQKAAMPIAALSAHAYAEDRRMSSEVGMDAHLTKPIDPTELLQLLVQFLGNQ